MHSGRPARIRTRPVALVWAGLLVTVVVTMVACDDTPTPGPPPSTAPPTAPPPSAKADAAVPKPPLPKAAPKKKDAGVDADTKKEDPGLPTIGLANEIAQGKPLRWPFEISISAPKPATCDSQCEMWHGLEMALAKSARWMARFDPSKLRFEAAIAVSALVRVVGNPALRQVRTDALTMANKDMSNPLRKLWDASATAAPDTTSGWFIPGYGEKRVNHLRVLGEALHCKKNGWRPKTTLYVAGAMRDAGGPGSVYGLWSLEIAAQHGCIPRPTAKTLATKLVEEIVAAQPETLTPTSTREITLYALRLLALIRSRPTNTNIDMWAQTLVSLQNADGSWTTGNKLETAYDAFDATATASWALATWLKVRSPASTEEK